MVDSASLIVSIGMYVIAVIATRILIRYHLAERNVLYFILVWLMLASGLLSAAFFPAREPVSLLLGNGLCMILITAIWFINNWHAASSRKTFLVLYIWLCGFLFLDIGGEICFSLRGVFSVSLTLILLCAFFTLSIIATFVESIPFWHEDTEDTLLASFFVLIFALVGIWSGFILVFFFT